MLILPSPFKATKRNKIVGNAVFHLKSLLANLRKDTQAAWRQYEEKYIS